MIHAVMVIFFVKTAIGSFEYKSIAPLNLFPSCLAVQDTDDPGSITNPSYLPSIKNPYINFSMDTPYTIEGLSANSMSLGAPLGQYGFQFAWRRFGIREYREDIAGANIGTMPFRWISLGAGVDYYSLRIDAGEITLKTGLLDYRASVRIIPFPWGCLSFEQDNIRSLIEKEREDLLFPESRFGLSISPVRGFSLSWNMSRTFYGYVNFFSVGARLLPFLIIKGGYSRETSTYSAAFALAQKNLSVSYGFRFHSYLGLTHVLGVTASYNSMTYENVEYYSRRKVDFPDNPDKKVDLNKCTAPELKKIPGLTETMARRILKYRELMGPVSKKTLGQMGMSDREIERLMKYVNGLADDENKQEVREIKGRGKAGERHGKISFHKNIRTMKERKQIFEKLLNTGLNASLSLMLSEAAVKKEFREIQDAVDSIPGLDHEKKKEILRICRE